LSWLKKLKPVKQNKRETTVKGDIKMFKQIITITLTVAIGWTMIFVAGCQNDAQTGAALGGLAGAGIGQLAGRDTEATLIGAAVGAGTGYIIGNESDKNKTQAQMQAMQDNANSQIVNVTNSNGSIVQVRLRRYGVGWVGTRGEYYPSLPTSEQLRPVYGF
jgi:outer membrane lipoprotein SlyB